MSSMDKLKTLIPLEEIEVSAQEQIFKALANPFLLKMAVMPDCHTGYDLPIGGVALLDGVISPSYVGYDIGCGVCSYKTEYQYLDFSSENYKSIWKKIKEIVPNGEGRERANNLNPFGFSQFTTNHRRLKDRVTPKLIPQMGTLGGGNHFIEIGICGDTRLAITIHSGSRNPGHSVGGYYMELSKTADTDLPPGFFHLDSEYGKDYLKDMVYMCEYALQNRWTMMIDVLKIMHEEFAQHNTHRSCDTKYEINLEEVDSMMINENHNHATVNPDGTVLHRKGATPAEKGVLGVIPGSMASGVYVTSGLGNEEFLCSASHGAGRKMGRTKAKKSIPIETFVEQMKGIICSTDKSLLDEAPDAYKDIQEVINRQKGVVIDVVDLIKPIVNVKGDSSRNPSGTIHFVSASMIGE